MASPRGRCYEARITRLCIFHLDEESRQRLKALDRRPCMPIPMVSLCINSIKGVIGLYVRFLLWKRMQQSHRQLHRKCNEEV